jgi:FtsH-binding integral membrane protein
MFQDQGYAVQTTHVSFMHRVYAWMSGALFLTAVVAWYTAHSTTFALYTIQHPFVLFGICMAQLALVVVLSGFLSKMNYATAIALFIVYAASLGVTLSIIFRQYTESSIAVTFVTAAAMFGGMALYGYFTRTDLTQLHSILIMVLLGLIIASLVNLWLRNSVFDTLISGVGVLLFALLTAADTQKLKHLEQALQFDQEGKRKVAIIGALTLYLDFINLFLFLLRFMGNRKNQ